MSNARKKLKKGTYFDPDPSKTQNKADLANQFDKIRTSFKKNNSALANSHTSSNKNLYIISGLIIVVILGGVVLAFGGGSLLVSPQPPSGNTYLTACLTDVQVNIHFHPYLTLTINGNPQTIPADIGIESNCNRPIHTHDTTGYIHVESASSLNLPSPTLGDFFDIWRQTFFGSAGQWPGTVSAVVTLNGNHYGTYINNTNVNNIPLLDGGQTINGYGGAGEDIAITITQ